MKEVIVKEILYDLDRAINILTIREAKDLEELKVLSEHSIEDVALHKDLDLVSVSVLLYSLYKILPSMEEKKYQSFLTLLKSAKENLTKKNLARYNRDIKSSFDLVRTSNESIKEHLQDVMHAARIKKSASLLQHGLSIGQAAGLMGLSNWDLQQYVGRTVFLEQHQEFLPAKKRLLLAMDIFGVK